MKKAEYNWNLDDIISLDLYPALFAKTRAQIDELSKMFDDAMVPEMSTQEFINFSNLYEEVIEGMQRLGGRASLMESVNQKDQVALKLKNQLKDLQLYSSEKTQKISQWLKGREVAGKTVLDDSNAERLFLAVPDLSYVLHYSRRQAGHSLDEKEESIVMAKDSNGVSVINDLRDIIETEFKFSFKPKDKTVEIIETLAEINGLTYSADPYTREEAYRARFEQYSQNIDKFFIIYQAIVKDWNYEAKLRGYDSAISMRNSANHVSDQAIATLMEVCENNSEIFQQFFIYKAKMLGVEKLRRFDIYAPIGELKTSLSYESALELVLESFDDFSADFANKAREIIASNHVDALPSANKRSGAFCATIAPSTKPYVLLNYSGKGSDVSTLAHELGHGVHSIYAQEHSISSQHPSLPLAETASTFAEMVLFEKLLAKTTDRDEKKLMLTDKIASSYASILRQNFFVKFEIEAHQKIQEGITEQELSALWMKTLQDQFGESVEVDEMFRHEWAYIPHIHHTPFYCYAYNFGELLSMALYQRYKNEGDSFIAVIEKILSAGGSQDPAVVLQEAGIDMASAEFWQGSFTIIEGWISQLEAL